MNDAAAKYGASVLETTPDPGRGVRAFRSRRPRPVPRRRPAGPLMVPEAKLEQLPEGLGAEGPGWFVLNARDARWWERQGLGRWCDLEGDGDFAQLGMRIAVIRARRAERHVSRRERPGELPRRLRRVRARHRRRGAAPEGLGLRPLPAVDGHVFVGAGDGPCVIVTVGARTGDDEILYPVNDVAATHGASVAAETPFPKEAYAPYPREPLFQPYRREGLRSSLRRGSPSPGVFGA